MEVHFGLFISQMESKGEETLWKGERAPGEVGGGKHSFLASGKVGKLPIVSKFLFQTRINFFQQPCGVIQARMIMPQEK